MPWIRFSLTLATVVAVTVSAAVLQGRLRYRLGPPDAVRKAAARLEEFPREFGDWQATSEVPLEDEVQNMLNSVGKVVRVYSNAKTGDEITLLFFLGPMGPTAVHTPEVCIGQREFTPLGDRRELAIGDRSDRFWGKRFKSMSLHGESLSAYWAWTADGTWIAARDARFKFSGLAYLYKAQVTSRLRGRAEGDSSDAGQRFLADFVPLAAKYTSAEINH